MWHSSSSTPEMTLIISWIVSKATLPFWVAPINPTSTTCAQGERQTCLAEVTSHPWAVGDTLVQKAVFAALRAIHKQKFVFMKH